MVTGASLYVTRWLTTPGPLIDARTVIIEPGTGFGRIADALAADGVVTRPRLLRLVARVTGDANRVQAGEYRFPAAVTPSQAMTMLVTGDVVLHTVRLLEGWTVNRALAEVRAEPALAHTLGTDVDAGNLLGVLGVGDGHAEGRLYPDTYRYRRGQTDRAVLLDAYRAMERVLAEEWAARSGEVSYTSPYEALIVASLVEKETGRPEDRDKIARVFVARLARGMRLQTDPTVIYGLGERFDGNLTRAHLNEATPYNTYVHRGLPPTPIAMPGLASIRAALHPAPGDYLYFVARGDGSSEFSATLEEHVAAVRRYQLGQGHGQ